MIDPHDCVFFVPPALKKFKLDLFERIARHISDLGGMVIRHDYEKLKSQAWTRIPIVGCSPPFRNAIQQWRETNTPWIYWDRGYLRRWWSKGLPPANQVIEKGGYYRWHVGEFQLSKLRDVPDDRWKALRLDGFPKPWRQDGGPILVADTLPDYWNVRGLSERWSYETAAWLKSRTQREIIVRDKESKIGLDAELLSRNCHCLLTHGSIAAVEAVILGFPVFVDSSCAAALVGRTDLNELENPVRPDRTAWLHNLAYSQFTEKELCDGTLWRLLQ